MVDPVVLVALALLAGPQLALAPMPTAAAAVAMTIVLGSRVKRGALAMAAIALTVGGLRARSALERAQAVHAQTTLLLATPSRCEGEGTVETSPVVVGRTHPDPTVADASSARVDVVIKSGTCNTQPLAGPLRARIYGAPETLARGDRVTIVADLAPLQLFKNRELPDARPSIARSGVAASGGAVEVVLTRRSWSLPALIDHARAHVRSRIEATYHPDAASLGRALVLGETDLDPEDDLAFRESGLSHLLAVSGTHLVIAVAGFASALRAVLVRIRRLAERVEAGRVAAALAIPSAWIYADFAGGSGSAVRAAAMLSAAMLARAIGRRAPVARSFACSLLVLGAIDPLLSCDVSFGLSACATAGLVVLQKPIAAAIVRGPWLVQRVLEPVATTLAAMVGCTPLLAVLSPTLPLLGTASNLLAAPLGELLALPICLGHALLSWAPPVERCTALLGSGALLAVRAIARWSVAAGATIAVPPPSAPEFAVIAVTGVAALLARSHSRRAAVLSGGAAMWALAELWEQREGAPRGKLRVSVLDVGQGDAVLIDLPNGGAVLVDGGGMVGSPIDLGARVLQPVLRVRRRKRLDVVVVSHPHPDHFGGLVSTLPRVALGELWDTGQGEDQGAGSAYSELVRGTRRRGIPIQRPDTLCGSPWTAEGATIEVLAPCPGYAPDEGANENSFVLRVAYGNRVALLVGDAEHNEEKELLRRRRPKLRADFLKVGHHGSRTSTSPAFLAEVRPAVAAISAGVRNRFGHPHPNTLATLNAEHVTIGRTDRGGAVVWETDGKDVHVSRP